jgi:UDP:flavonoid glycosyltransferase YjiC (YdhE family)
MDIDATVEQCRALLKDAPRLVARERSFIRECNVRLIAADVPAFGFAAADAAGVPSAAITNFTWTGIYRSYLPAYPEFGPVIDEMSRFYGHATAAFTLPYSFDLDVFPRREAIPWIARRSTLGRQEARKELGLPEAATLILLSFGGLGLKRLPWEKLKALRQFFFIVTADERRLEDNVLVLPDAQRHYENLLAAVDAVITKPGYGIVADVISHRLPVLYTDRGEFPEYPHLVRALQDCATAAFIPQQELFAGALEPYLTRLLSTPPHWPAVELNGATVAADKLLALLE